MFCSNLAHLLSQAPAAALRRLSGRRSVVLLKHREAIGDTLMFTALARALKKALPDLRVAVATRHSELFLNNPYVDENRDWHLFRTRYTVRLNYTYENPRHTHHVEAMWMDLWDLLAERSLSSGSPPPLDGRHPEIFLTGAERTRGEELLRRKERPVVVLVSGGKLKPTHNREWGYENFAALAQALDPHADLLQISGERALVLTGSGRAIRNIRVSLREAAAVLAACDAFVTLEGGMMHIARAVNAPTVAIFGGTLLPDHTGYDRMENLFSRPACSPCIGQRTDCPHLKCMVPITPRVVARVVAGMLKKRGFERPGAAIDAAPDAWEPPAFVNREILSAELARK